MAVIIKEHLFRIEYLLPAELFPAALIGGGLPIWAALRARARQRPIGWGLGIAAGLLVGGQVLAFNSGNSIHLLDPNEKEILATFYDEGSLEDCVFSPDGEKLLVGGNSGRLHILKYMPASLPGERQGGKRALTAPDMLMEKARQAFEAGNYPDALENMNDALKHRPEDIHLLY